MMNNVQFTQRIILMIFTDNKKFTLYSDKMLGTQPTKKVMNKLDRYKTCIYAEEIMTEK